eukprot:TRINITY_DN2128_c0_g1_i1.p2 TRINITY_DN2128_c0_g1~~TRINITY_DN2128_c0_g1_i1.p2  ORF type:complete len:194 (+),score=66.92 TRINITY_DN2128_c0_g1_i1:88-669(+)
MGADMSTMIITCNKKAYLDAPASWAYAQMSDARVWFAAYSEHDDSPVVNLHGPTIKAGCEFDAVKKVKVQQQKTSGNYRTTWMEMRDVSVELKLEEATPDSYVKFWGKETWVDSNSKVGDPYVLEFRINPLSPSTCEVEATMTFSNSSACLIPCVLLCGSCIKNAAQGKMGGAQIKLKKILDGKMKKGGQGMR